MFRGLGRLVGTLAGLSMLLVALEIAGLVWLCVRAYLWFRHHVLMR